MDSDIGTPTPTEIELIKEEKIENNSFTVIHKNPRALLKQISSRRIVDSPRELWLQDPNKKDAAQDLCKLYIISITILISCIVAISTVDSNMINIFIFMDFDGDYIWNLGWYNAKFTFMNNAAENQVAFYANYKLSDIAKFFPISNIMIYMKNAGYLLVIMCIISIISMSVVLFILFHRTNSHKSLYIKWFCCKLPQRSSIHFLMTFITPFILCTIIYYVFLIFYSFFEMFFIIATTSGCPPGNKCWSLATPHYGLSVLTLTITPLLFFVHQQIRKIDIPFDIHSIKYYYPDNLLKIGLMPLKLDLLFKVVNSLKYIIILSIIMFISFRDSGLISIWIHNTTAIKVELGGSNMPIIYFQFQGLVNEYGIGQLQMNFTSPIFNTKNTLSPITISNQDIYIDYNSSELFFEFICNGLYYFLLTIIIINLFIILPYIWTVIHQYDTIHNALKCVLLFIGFSELLIYSVLIIAYYVAYYVFFYETAQSKLETKLKGYKGDIYDTGCFPDWGFFICIALWFYLARFVYMSFRAMQNIYQEIELSSKIF